MDTACSTGIDARFAGLVVRDLRASDRDAFAAMFARLSPQSRLRRYYAPKPRLTARELRELTDVDHVAHSAIAAIGADGRMIGVARYAAAEAADSTADVAVEVVDEWQNRGVGTLLTARVVGRASSNGITLLRATTMWDNTPARALLRSLGFRVRGTRDGLLELELRLR